MIDPNRLAAAVKAGCVSACQYPNCGCVTHPDGVRREIEALDIYDGAKLMEVAARVRADADRTCAASLRKSDIADADAAIARAAGVLVEFLPESSVGLAWRIRALATALRARFTGTAA